MPARPSPRRSHAVRVVSGGALLLLAAVPAWTRPAAAATASPSVGSCPMLPADNVWNTDVSTLPVHPMSATWIQSSGGPSRLIHPDWGPSGGSVPYGIPWQLVDGSHQKVAVSFEYADESDPGPYPLGPDTPIEGGSDSTGDRHALVVDQSTCTLYETWSTYYAASGSHAGSGAMFDLRSDALRPAGWTSADAAGLPILPGLVRWTEVRSGAIRHAIRFTVQQTDRAYLWPARHQAGAASNPALPPMGARFRLKRSVDISHYSADTRVILTAMQHYGMIVADNGSNWYFQGDTDPGWSDQVISELKTVPAGDFEAVDESSLMIDPNSGAARQPATAPPAATPHRSPAAGTPSPVRAPSAPASAALPSGSASPAAVPTATPAAPSGAVALLPSPRTTLSADARAGNGRADVSRAAGGAGPGWWSIAVAAAAAAAAVAAWTLRRARGRRRRIAR